eukprot:jgi/Tetstr1/456141/TSEL_042910.t1
MTSSQRAAAVAAGRPVGNRQQGTTLDKDTRLGMSLDQLIESKPTSSNSIITAGGRPRRGGGQRGGGPQLHNYGQGGYGQGGYGQGGYGQGGYGHWLRAGWLRAGWLRAAAVSAAGGWWQVGWQWGGGRGGGRGGNKPDFRDFMEAYTNDAREVIVKYRRTEIITINNAGDAATAASTPPAAALGISLPGGHASRRRLQVGTAATAARLAGVGPWPGARARAVATGWIPTGPAAKTQGRYNPY